MTHPYLPDLLRLGRQTEIISEVVDNHRLIEAVVGHGPAFFRAPFGGWEPGLAKLLNRPAYLREYMGPVNWDIERCDYGLDKIIDKQPYDSGDLRAAAIGSTYTFEMCKDNYWLKFRAERKGIVLLHDWAADEGPDGDFLREHNRIFELTEWLVPKLKDDGFTFVRLDDQRLGAC
jgi:peptidoglycan/xylan/chitin deacetylase (PgdA/CDA1 family)